MSSKKVTIEEVQANMKDIMCETRVEFGVPTTYVTVRMKNGFTVRESTTCVDPANYDENVGREVCLKKITDQIFQLLGYALQEDLSEENETKEITDEFISIGDGDGIGFVSNGMGYKIQSEGKLVAFPVSYKQAKIPVYVNPKNPIRSLKELEFGKTYCCTVLKFPFPELAFIKKMKDDKYLTYFPESEEVVINDNDRPLIVLSDFYTVNKK